MPLVAQLTVSARWLAMALVSLALLGQGALAGFDTGSTPAKRCCNKCSCCVSKAPSNAATPISPAASFRGELQKMTVNLTSLPATSWDAFAIVPLVPSPAPASPAGLPLYERNCSYLI